MYQEMVPTGSHSYITHSYSCFPAILLVFMDLSPDACLLDIHVSGVQRDSQETDTSLFELKIVPLHPECFAILEIALDHNQNGQREPHTRQSVVNLRESMGLTEFE